MAGLLGVALVSNSLVRPVDARHFTDAAAALPLAPAPSGGAPPRT